MYYMESVFPAARRVHIPITRDQAMLLMAAMNEIMLGAETFIAHQISGTVVPNEWIPIIFGPIAGVLLILAGILALRNRPAATVIATLVFLASILVGLLGAFFHVRRAILPAAPVGEQVSVPLLVWAPPILGPLTFSLVGLLGISSAWREDPPDSGILALLGGRHLRLPYSKTRAYFFMVSMGSLATVISSVLDHARTNFTNPWLWVPTGVGVFATVVAAMLGILEKPKRGDLMVYVLAMTTMIITGIIGTILHIENNLTSEGVIVGERFIRGAPFLAPLLFSDIGAIGFLVLLDPKEKEEADKS
jgi:hypothetical protein